MGVRFLEKQFLLTSKAGNSLVNFLLFMSDADCLLKNLNICLF